MKTITRHEAFETNSSSTHSICVCSENKITEEDFKIFANNSYRPYEVKVGEYGWDLEEYNSFESKLDYIYIYLESSRRDKETAKINEINYSKVPEYLRGGPKFMEWLTDYFKKYDLEFHWKLKSSNYGGYIDHQSVGRGNDMEYILKSKKSILNYLFNDDVTVKTDNDN